VSLFFPGDRTKQPGTPFPNSQYRNLDVVKNSQIRKDVDHLERPAEPQPDPFVNGQLGDILSLKQDLSGIHRQGTGKHVDQGGFACPIGSDNGCENPLFKGEIDPVGRYHLAKSLMQFPDFEERHGHGLPPDLETDRTL